MKALALVVLASCAVGVEDPLPAPPQAPDAQHAFVELDAGALETPECSRRDRIVVVGGFVFDVPLPCTPLPSRDLGDPQP